ncbi:MAG: hypothetical protein ABI969_08620 [bacterium]
MMHSREVRLSNMHEDGADNHNAGVVAFLRYMMTPEEQQRPRFAPVLRMIGDVKMGELRVHPDLVERLVALDGPDGEQRLRMLMGAAVLVAKSGAAYAFAYSQTFLAVRIPSDAAEALGSSARLKPVAKSEGEARARQPQERVDALGPGWTLLEPWNAPVAELRTAVRNAHAFADANLV